jgi:hypothetical protein
MSLRNEAQKPRTPKVHHISVKANDGIYQLIAAEADRHNPPLALGEVLIKLAAAHFKRPDLDHVPRKRSGRPRTTKETAKAS